jgi:hypothetical protein
MYKEIIFLMFLLSASFYFSNGKESTIEEQKSSVPSIHQDSRAWSYEKNAVQADSYHLDATTIGVTLEI